MRVYSYGIKMTVEEIYIKLKDELTADNESSSSPERIFIKNEEQTICTLGMNRSHEIIFVEFKPAQKDLAEIEREGFVHPHPVEMLHDAGWRQAQITSWEEAEKLLIIIRRSYKRKKPKAEEPEKPRRKDRIAALRAAHAARVGMNIASRGKAVVVPSAKDAGKKKIEEPKGKAAAAKAKVLPPKAAPTKAIKAKVKAKPKAKPKSMPKKAKAAKAKAGKKKKR
jgi:hypothetical protein